MVTDLKTIAQDLVHRRAGMVHQEIQSALALYAKMGQPAPDLTGSPWFALLERLYTEELPLAKVVDQSELIARAEGPALEATNPRLDIVTWLCSGIQSQTRLLTASALNLGPKSRAVQSVRFRLTGLAPGSLFAGFTVVSDGPPITVTELALADNADGDSVAKSINVVEAVRDSISNLTKATEHVRDVHVSEALSEQITDPAQRDASLLAAFKLSPTGRNGVSSVQLQSMIQGRTSHGGVLDANNRIVIQDIISNRPLLAKDKKTGSFIGQLRGVDLDKTRVDLRGVKGIGHLRCIINLDATNAASILGRWVKVTGDYEVNASGRPRLMVAQSIEPAAEPAPGDRSFR